MDLRYRLIRRMTFLRHVFALAAAASITALTAPGAMGKAAKPRMPEPAALEKMIKTEIEAFRVAMQSGDFKTLHAHGSKQFRDAVKLEEIDKALRPMVGAFEPLSVVKPLNPTFSEPPRIDEGGVLRLLGHFDAPDHVVTFKINMVMNDGEWRYLDLNVNHDSPQQASTPLVPIPAGQRLPMPPPDEADKLLRSNMAMFSTAMKTGNFEDMHRLGARAVREKNTLEKLSEAMKPLVGKFDSMETIATLQPHYSEPPRIDGNGRLIFRGQFGTTPLKSVFVLDLVPEDGAWRYENISVSIK